MPEILIPQGTIHYTDQGIGTPLVLLHANPGDHRDFEAIVPALARRYRVLALDWPGYGNSRLDIAPSQADARFFCDALRAFVFALNLPPAVFIGNSLGGNAAARLAIESPECVRGLVLAAGGGFTPHNVVTRAFCRFMGSRYALSPRRWAGLYLGQQTATVRSMLQRAASEQSTPERLALNRAVWRSFASADHDLREAATAIIASTLLVYGRYDPALPARKDGISAARCIPGAKLVVMPCRHAAFAEMPEIFLDHLAVFLEEVSRSPDSSPRMPRSDGDDANGSGAPA